MLSLNIEPFAGFILEWTAKQHKLEKSERFLDFLQMGWETDNPTNHPGSHLMQYVSEYDIRENFDRNEYPNIFVSKNYLNKCLNTFVNNIGDKKKYEYLNISNIY